MSTEETISEISTKTTNPKQIQRIDANKELDNIFKDIKFIYSNLFKLTLSKDNIIVNEECINKFDEFFDSEEEDINNIQILFLTKVMLYLISILKNNNKINDDEIDNKEKKYNDKLRELVEDFKNDKKFCKFNQKPENIKEYNLDKIILDIVEYFMNEMFKEKEKKDYKLIKNEWDSLKINLEHLEINGETKQNLYLFIENDIKMKDYYKNLNFKKKPKILLEIYEYIDYEISKNEIEESKKKERLKDLGDKERKNKDFGRLNDNDLGLNNYNNLNSIKNPKIPKSELKLVYEKFKIKIVDLTDIRNPLILIGPDEQSYNSSYEENVKYDLPTEDDINFNKYLEFKEQVLDYVEQFQDEIILNENERIVLELITFNYRQEGQLLNNGSEIPKNLHDVRCFSYVETEKNKIKQKKIGTEVIDDNVLVYGINGITPGFIFLINELCIEDNKKNKND